MIPEADTKWTPGHAPCRASRNRDQVWSPMAAVSTPASRSRTSSTGRSRSPQATTEHTSGSTSTRGASSSGTSSVTGPSIGITAMVRRSDSMAR